VKLRQSGFTLTELLVVMGIAALLVGMLLGSFGGEQRSAQVKAAADQLAAVLGQARSLAIANQAMYGVAFNIQNEPGSSGAVLNNRSGGHWYRMLGPVKGLGRYVYEGRIARVGKPDSYHGYPLPNFPDFLEEVRRDWVSEPYVLPARRVRILALADTDEGARRRKDTPNGSGTVWYGSGGETTYPRPWFGYYDGQRLWPWGGYDPARPTSGFWYQGSGPAVVGCRNPVDRRFDNNTRKEQGANGASVTQVLADVDLDGDGLFDSPGERELAYPVLVQGAPRPLVNADWLDYAIVFLPDGRAMATEWNQPRRQYANQQATLTGSTNQGRNGVDDLAKATLAVTGWSHTLFTGQGFACWYDIPEVAHFTRHTGGWFVTLAPDALDDRTVFPSAADALASITPMFRVFVGVAGVIRVLPVHRREGAYAGQLWPADPADWLSTATTGANPVWSRCRLGELHVTDVASTSRTRSLPPLGTPVTTVVNTDMLRNKRWWMQ
jgi:prepilin-type N-terminal cleavage/methylation domain-containing protein